MRLTGIVLAGGVLLASAANASPIFEAFGNWTGEGRVVTAVNAPLERGRCKLDIDPAAAGRDISLTGKCVVAGGASQVAIRIIGDGTNRVRAGFWTAATDQTIQMRGTDNEQEVVLRSIDPVVLDDIAYDSQVVLRFPDAESFSIEQSLRGPDSADWRLVVDMTFHKTEAD